MEIQYSEITVQKITRNLYEATCMITNPIKSEVSMKGVTEDIAKQKLQLFLKGEPYKHLYNL